MKTLTSTIVVVLMLIAATPEIRSQSTDRINLNSITSLKNGITSNNAGLRKSSIYMAGLYKVKEVAPLLAEEMKKELDPSTKILIALSLFKTGDENFFGTIETMAKMEKDDEARRMMYAITEQIKMDRTYSVPAE